MIQTNQHRSLSCWLIAIVVIVAVIAVLTLSVAVIDTPTGNSFPYTTTYRVSIPDSQPISIGSSKILVLTMGNEVDTSVDGVKERLAIGQERTISARYARISALGMLRHAGHDLPAGPGDPHPADHPARHGRPANLNNFLFLCCCFPDRYRSGIAGVFGGDEPHET